MAKEMCVTCDEETGRAGRSEDSMYPVLSIQIGLQTRGDEFGPVCEECYKAMDRLGLIDHEA